MRRVAIAQLAQNFKDDPAMFEVFYSCAVNHLFARSHESSNPNPWYIALDIIIKQFPLHPQTLPLLREKAENNPDEKVREFAQKKLRLWGGKR